NADAVVNLAVTWTILQQHQHGAIVVEANDTSAVDVSVTSSQVLRNTAGLALPYHGAGIRIEDASTTPMTVSLTNVTLDRNRMRSSSTDGAGMALSAAAGSTLTVDVDGGVFTRNRARQGLGAAIFGVADSAGQIDLSLGRSRLQGNRAKDGGGAYLLRVALA